MGQRDAIAALLQRGTPFIAWLVALLFLSSPCHAAGYAMASDDIVDATICDLVATPERFDERIVRVTASYESDGMHYWTLLDPECRGGVLPSGQAHDPVVGRSLLAALQRGCAGTLDKQISATWIGRYHWDPKNMMGTGKVPRWIDVQRIEGLTVARKATSLPCSKSSSVNRVYIHPA